MSSIYIHIPFCKQACTYCDFHFSTNQKLRQPLADALCQEIAARSDEERGPIQSLYFGGGSPSILSEGELIQIFERLHQHFDLSALSEVTLESNPDDHSSEKLNLWRKLGIDRLSIGIQSFIDRDLELMHRAHNAKEADRCIKASRDAGFESLTIDLIYGIPGQSMAQWQSNVQKAILLEPDHISAYCLTVEDRTALDHQVKKGLVQEKEDDIIEKEYLFLHRKLEDCGFEHYEISNFGKPGKRAIHNSNYWSGRSYLGFGPAAHSFDGKNKRRWNVANNPKYIKAIAEGTLYWEEEILSERDQVNELLLTGLRRKDGVNLTLIKPQHRSAIASSLEALEDHLKQAIDLTDGHLRIKPERWLMADAVIRELMIEE